MSPSSRKITGALFILGLAALAACGPIPRPFQPDHKPPPPVSDDLFVSRAGIAVTAPQALAEADAETLAAAIAHALTKHDIIATAGPGNRASLVLSARAQGSTLHWRLASPGGAIFTELTLDYDAAAAPLAHAHTLAAHIADRLRPSPDPATDAAQPTLTVLPVDGAPGDGRGALSRAMAHALAANGYIVSPDLAEATLLLAGSVYVSAAGTSREAVAIEWTLMRLDGRRLGTVAQENTIPAGSLDGRWGPTAQAVALAGVDGVVALLQETMKRNK